MQLIGRTLVILVAALVVVGVTFAVSRSSYAAGMRGSFPQDGPRAGRQLARPEQSLADGQQGADQPFERGGFEGRERGPGGSVIFGILGVLRNVVVIGVIVAGVALVSRLTRRDQPDKPARRLPPSDPPALI